MSADDELQRDGLKHNPFAKLFGKKPEETPPPPAPPPPTSRGSSKRETTVPASRAGSASPPSPERVIVRRERKGHGGKGVTIAEGPGLSGHDVAQMAREAAKALGTGAREDHGTLVVQGEMTERLTAWLEKHGFTSVVRGN